MSDSTNIGDIVNEDDIANSVQGFDIGPLLPSNLLDDDGLLGNTDNTNDSNSSYPFSNIPSSSSSSSLGILETIPLSPFNQNYINELLNLPPTRTSNRHTNAFSYSNSPLTSTSASVSLGILEAVSQSGCNTNRNELENLPPTNNATNQVTGNLVNLHSPTTNNENREISSEFIEYRNNIINNLLNEGRIRLFNGRPIDRRQTNRGERALTVDDFLTTNNDVPDFHIGGVPVQWIGSFDNPIPTFDESDSFTSDDFNNIQQAAVENWSRRLDALRSSTGTIRRPTWDRLIGHNTNRNSSSGGEFSQQQNDFSDFDTNTFSPILARTNTEAISLENLTNNFQNPSPQGNDFQRRLDELRNFSTNNLPVTWNHVRERNLSSMARSRNIDSLFSDLDAISETDDNIVRRRSLSSLARAHNIDIGNIFSELGVVPETDDDDETLFEDETAPSSSFMPWNVINIDNMSMLVDEGDSNIGESTISAQVANITQNENQSWNDSNSTANTSSSSPLPWTRITVENFFSNAQSTDSVSLVEDTAESLEGLQLSGDLMNHQFDLGSNPVNESDEDAEIATFILNSSASLLERSDESFEAILAFLNESLITSLTGGLNPCSISLPQSDSSDTNDSFDE